MGAARAWLKERGVIPVAQAVDLVVEAGVAIAQAHAVGVVHCDLKPSNLFCVRGAGDAPMVKVLDFGVSELPDAARARGGAASGPTSNLVGSPHSMAPEQFRAAGAVDARTDVWALGVILYEVLAGRQPFRGYGVRDVAARVAAEPPRRAAGRAGGLASVIGRCLRKDPGARPPTSNCGHALTARCARRRRGAT